MVERQGACQTFFLHLPSELDNTFVDCRVILFNRTFPDKSVAARKHVFDAVDRREVTEWECCLGKQGRGWLLKIPTGDFRLSFSDSQEGFLHDGWLLFGLRIAILDKQSACFPHPRAFERAMVSVEVITDRRIREHVENRGLSRVFRIPRSKTYILPVHAPLETVREKARRQVMSLFQTGCAGTDRARCWATCSAVDDMAVSFPVQRHLCQSRLSMRSRGIEAMSWRIGES